MTDGSSGCSRLTEREGVAAEEFGPYRLETLIGLGGMGEAYRAVAPVSDTPQEITKSGR